MRFSRTRSRSAQRLYRRATRFLLAVEPLEDRRLLATFVDAVDDPSATSEDTPLAISALANDTTDGATPPTIVGVTQPLHGTASVNADGAIQYTPEANFYGNDSFSYTISDGAAGPVEVTPGRSTFDMFAKANSTNDPATLDDDFFTNMQLGTTSMLDGSVSAVSAAAGKVVMEAQGEATWTSPSQGQVFFANVVFERQSSFQGSASLAEGSGWTYQFTASSNGTFVVDYNIAVTNTFGAQYLGEFRVGFSSDWGGSFQLVNADNLPSAVGQTSFPVLAGVTYTATIHNNFAIAWAGQFGMTDREAMNALFNFRIEGAPVSDTAAVNVAVAAVNDAPVAADDAATTDEDTPVAIFILANDTDVDGDSLRVTAVSQPAHGTAIIGVSAPFIGYTPNPGFFGTDTFTYTISDGKGGQDTATITVTVAEVDHPPVADDLQLSTSEDTAVSGQVSATDDDPAATVTFDPVAGPSHGTLQFNSLDGTFTYTPHTNFNGTDTFDYVASDGQQASERATVTITVAPVNDTPIAHGWQHGTFEDTTLNSFLRASDVDGDSLIYSVVDNPDFGVIQLSPTTGAFTYLANPQYSGSDVFTFRVFDGTVYSNTARVFISVHAVNDSPVTESQQLVTQEDVGKSGQLDAVDVDSTLLTYAIITPPAHGALAGFNASTGAFTYVPAAEYSGADFFTFTASDGNKTSNRSTVHITVEPVNDAPVSLDQAATTDEDQPIAGQLSASDADSASLTYTIVSGPAHGTLTAFDPATGAYTYAPSANYHGGDAFTFAASDGSATSSTATVSLTVAPVNDAPEATDAVFSLAEDAAAGFLLGTIAATDVDDIALSFALSGADAAALSIDAATGEISVADPTLLDYETKPTLNVSVTVTDVAGAQDTASVTIHVTDVLEVAIDIAPSDPVNRIDLGSATIEVAILAAVGFDPLSELDLASLRLQTPGSSTSAGVTQHPKHGYRYEQRDVNGDGLLDLVVRFDTSDTGLQTGDTSLQLSGRLADGETFVVEQAVEAVTSRKGGKGGGKGGGGKK